MGLSAVSRALEPAIVTAFSDRKKKIILHQKCRNSFKEQVPNLDLKMYKLKIRSLFEIYSLHRLQLK